MFNDLSKSVEQRVKWIICLKKGEPSSKAKYGVIRNSE